ncbi:hypothetical protein EDD16DRAFT_1652598 [Pisolithus croceorrhizus]|nr:hypothetical protein EDD16DRAFT_1652598 [Pisolithus croceorrhizus]
MLPKPDFSSPKVSSPSVYARMYIASGCLPSPEIVGLFYAIFDGCRTDNLPVYELELVLRKWYPVDHSREIRCCVRFFPRSVQIGMPA